MKQDIILYSNTKVDDNLFIIAEYRENTYSFGYSKQRLLSKPIETTIEEVRKEINEMNINKIQKHKVVNHVISSVKDYYKQLTNV